MSGLAGAPAGSNGRPQSAPPPVRRAHPDTRPRRAGARFVPASTGGPPPASALVSPAIVAIRVAAVPTLRAPDALRRCVGRGSPSQSPALGTALRYGDY